jgi:ribonucleoside-diphosphate reductase alpha chain
MQVRKRDGSLVEYDRSKITAAMAKAFYAKAVSVDKTTLEYFTDDVERCFSEEITDVETIQDLVEKVLMEYPEVAKAYILYRQQRTELREVKPDPNAVADYIHAAKYARYLPNEKRRETFLETVNRVERMHIEKFPALKEIIQKAFDLVRRKEILPSMRSMQFAGKAIQFENARMYNCTFTLVDRPRVFSEILYLLLCGCGCGFSVQKHHINKLPKIGKVNKQLICHHKIVDTIQGWAEAVNSLIQGFLNGYYVQFDYSSIRPAGAELHRSGGKAPGHLALRCSLEEMRKILSTAEGRHLRPIECYDIICHLSLTVLAGGIRRSSLIALFSQDDEEMLHSKDGLNIGQRTLCNNSVVFDSTTSKQNFLDIMELNRTNYGEPGFVWLPEKDMGINPCGEILIDPTFERETGFGFCNLVEINTAICKSIEEAAQYATIIATLQASYTDFKYLSWVSHAVAERDALIGVSLTGIYDSKIEFTRGLLHSLVNIVKETNIEIAKIIGIHSSVRCTCIKPSGTASLELGGISSGIHSNHAKKYFRRITANSLEPVAQYFRRFNPQMVKVKPNGDWCITFPMAGHYEQQTAIEFLNRVKHFYDHWIIPGGVLYHHNISCTVTVSEQEWNDVFEFIWKFKPAGMAFLPAQSDKDIPFCPREAVITETDRTEYLSLIKSYIPIDYTKFKEDEDNIFQGAACDGELCEVPLFLDSGRGEQIFEGSFKEVFEFKNHTFSLVKQYDGYFVARMI